MGLSDSLSGSWDVGDGRGSTLSIIATCPAMIPAALPRASGLLTPPAPPRSVSSQRLFGNPSRHGQQAGQHSSLSILMAGIMARAGAVPSRQKNAAGRLPEHTSGEYGDSHSATGKGGTNPIASCRRLGDDQRSHALLPARPRQRRGTVWRARVSILRFTAYPYVVARPPFQGRASTVARPARTRQDAKRPASPPAPLEERMRRLCARSSHQE